MIKVIVADSSAVVRSIEKQIFSLNQDFEFLASVGDGKSLLEACRLLHPDLVVASNDIPEINKVLNSILLKEKCRVILLDSSENKSDFPKLSKPDFVSMSKIKMEDFLSSVKSLYLTINYKSSQKTVSSVDNDFKVILIGVSTGGPKSLKMLLSDLGKDFPLPILVTQHIDTTFDKSMVSWINKTVKIPTTLAEDREPLENGHVYFAPADCHLTLKKVHDKVEICLDKSEPVNFLRPSVDKMFESAVNIYKDGCLGILLTGMGNDGTAGCGKIKAAGGYVIGESEETCVIFGMPKSAFDAGVVDQMLPLYEIGNRVKSLVKGGNK